MDARIVILVPDFKKDYFIKEFALPSEALAKDGRRIFVEGISTRLERGDVFFRKAVLSITKTRALYIKTRSKFYDDGKLFPFLTYLVTSFLFGGFRLPRKILRFCDYYFFRTDFYEEILKKYDPTLVFSTDLQNELDVRLLKEAKRKGIKTIGMVRSWDNLTSKGFLRFLPDKLLVNNEIIKKEAEIYSDAKPEKIGVIGIPHYDRYLKMNFVGKNEFFASFGFDPLKKLVLFAPIGDRYIRNNALDQIVLEKLSELNVNILVRMPPTDTVSFKNFKTRSAKVFFEETGSGFERASKKSNELGKEDDEILAKVLSTELSDAGFEVLQAFDGEKGLALIKKFHPSAVLLDINLPKKSGLQVGKFTSNICSNIFRHRISFFEAILIFL